MRKFAAILTASVYFGLSSYCATCAIITGECHHHAAEAASHDGSRHDAEHTHDDADHHHDGAPGHDHSSDESGPCCTTFGDAGLTLPSTPRLPAKIVVTSLAVAVPTTEVSPADAAGCFSRMDHGPPTLPAQKTSLSSLAPRAPPVAVL